MSGEMHRVNDNDWRWCMERGRVKVPARKYRGCIPRTVVVGFAVTFSVRSTAGSQAYSTVHVTKGLESVGVKARKKRATLIGETYFDCNPRYALPSMVHLYCSVAKLVRHQTLNLKSVGSTPARAIQNKKTPCAVFCCLFQQ